MLHRTTFALITILALYFLVLGLVALFAPGRVRSFLLGFAETRAKHWLELGLRALAGTSLILHPPGMRFGSLAVAFGWILLATTLGLAVLPWRWHERFARQAVPLALRFTSLIGASSFALGAVLLYALFS